MGSVPDLFSGRPSSSSGKKAAGQQQNRRDTTNNYSCNSSSSSSTPRGQTGHALHGTITSALWAIARTPALVNAVENVEANFGEEPNLSRLLRQLRDASDAPSVRKAADAADVFLQGTGSRLSSYSKMEPMDVIRGIVGLCGDSDLVFQEAVETSYRCFSRFLPHV